MAPSRRDFLRAGGAALPVLAGCTSDGGGGPSGDGPTETDTATPPASPTPTATGLKVTETQVAPSVVAMTTPDSAGAVGERDEQFVVAWAAAGTEWPAYGALSMTADGTTYEPVDPEAANWSRALLRGERVRYPYEPGSSGFVLFRLPKPLDASTVELRGPEARLALPAAAVSKLARPPTSFEVEEFSVSGGAASGESVPVRLVVENVGDDPGTFVAGLNRVGPDVAYTPAAAAVVEIAAGATETWRYDYEVRAGTAEFRLNWRGGDEAATFATGTTTDSTES